jgi:hypothetical protein
MAETTPVLASAPTAPRAFEGRKILGSVFQSACRTWPELTNGPFCSISRQIKNGAKPVDETVVEAVLSLGIDDLELRLTRSGYDVRSLVEQFDAKPAENPPPAPW